MKTLITDHQGTGLRACRSERWAKEAPPRVARVPLVRALWIAADPSADGAPRLYPAGFPPLAVRNRTVCTARGWHLPTG